MFKTGGRTDSGRTAFWANGFGGENFLGERTDTRCCYTHNTGNHFYCEIAVEYILISSFSLKYSAVLMSEHCHTDH